MVPLRLCQGRRERSDAHTYHDRDVQAIFQILRSIHPAHPVSAEQIQNTLHLLNLTGLTGQENVVLRVSCATCKRRLGLEQ